MESGSPNSNSKCANHWTTRSEMCGSSSSGSVSVGGFWFKIRSSVQSRISCVSASAVFTTGWIGSSPQANSLFRPTHHQLHNVFKLQLENASLVKITYLVAKQSHSYSQCSKYLVIKNYQLRIRIWSRNFLSVRNPRVHPRFQNFL